MRGYRFTTDDRLPASDLQELADELAIQLHYALGERVFLLPRSDVAELIWPYIDDLHPDDQNDVVWLVWHLFQEAYELQEE
ncbi:hypothetical protein [Chloroflexus aggregans]|uniref:Uncharacterized protein n=1 Tax=Chloroflexus aggregans (strain MD-66 / DSM 9485) TaxID=326427 RepID=B8G6Y5_CHLAD|nr:hypothetical protein [Chloroflexus aggregans]ACL25944.1 conserved hypothetical protein [Chloroflexus aggregans DSM 9485]